MGLFRFQSVLESVSQRFRLSCQPFQTTALGTGFYDKRVRHLRTHGLQIGQVRFHPPDSVLHLILLEPILVEVLVHGIGDCEKISQVLAFQFIRNLAGEVIKQRMGPMMPASLFSYGLECTGGSAPRLFAGLRKIAPTQVVFGSSQVIPAHFCVFTALRCHVEPVIADFSLIPPGRMYT